MIEVEVKAKLDNFDEARENFSKLGVWLKDKEIQKDIMFGQDRFLDEEHKLKEGSIMARIRQKKQKVIVCFKEVNSGHAKFEAEFESPDLETAKKFLEKLDFKEAFEIEKLREHYGYKTFKICLDDVKELGRFIEVEKIVNKLEEKEKAFQECRDLLNFLCPGTKIQTKKYGDMMQDLINSRNKT
jgi:adenylate cyclase, class 2